MISNHVMENHLALQNISKGLFKAKKSTKSRQSVGLEILRIVLKIKKKGHLVFIGTPFVSSALIYYLGIPEVTF